MPQWEGHALTWLVAPTPSLQVVVKLIERHYILRRKVLYFVYGLRYAVRNTVWITLIVAVWNVLFPFPADRTVHIMTSVPSSPTIPHHPMPSC